MLEDVVPWLLGPAGIVLGWWLNQRTLRGNAERQSQQADAAAERQRVLDAVGLARDTAGLIRSPLHGIYLKAQYRQAPNGFTEMMDAFYRTKDKFRGSVLALRVLGPSWAVEGAERLDVEISKLAELGFLMQKGIKSEHLTTVNTRLPELDRMLREYVSTVSNHYNDAASELPPPRTWRRKAAARCSASDDDRSGPGPSLNHPSAPSGDQGASSGDGTTMCPHGSSSGREVPSATQPGSVIWSYWSRIDRASRSTVLDHQLAYAPCVGGGGSP